MNLTLVYWQEDGWYCGYLKEFPNTNSQARTLAGLKRSALSAYRDLVEMAEEEDRPTGARETRIVTTVA